MSRVGGLGSRVERLGAGFKGFGHDALKVRA